MFHQHFRDHCQECEDLVHQNSISVKIDNQTCSFFVRWIPTSIFD